MDKCIEIIVLHWTEVPSKSHENKSENSVLEEVITVTADIDVSKRLQLYIIPDAKEFKSVNGAILRYFLQISQLYPLRCAFITYRMGKAYETKLIKSGYGKTGKIVDCKSTFPQIVIKIATNRYARPVYDRYRLLVSDIHEYGCKKIN